MLMDGVFGGAGRASEAYCIGGGKGSGNGSESVACLLLRLYGAKFRTRNGRVLPFYAGVIVETTSTQVQTLHTSPWGGFPKHSVASGV